MKYIFGDTVYFSALLSPRDEKHIPAVQLSRSFATQVTIVTTDLVMTEFLNSFAGRGPKSRMLAADLVKLMRRGNGTIVEPLTAESYDAALDSYRRHFDKRWSLTDCLSFFIMQRYGIGEALTADHHFEQAGFKTLLR
jgi:uncharacterized protein